MPGPEAPSEEGGPEKEWWCAYRGVERARLVSDAFGPANDDDHVAEVSLSGNYLPAAARR